MPIRLAILCPRFSPYFHRLHERIVREVPCDLSVIYTHHSKLWAAGQFAIYNRISVATERDIDDVVSTTLTDHWHEFTKGKRLIKCIQDVRPDVVMTHGYRNPGVLRAMRWARRRGIATLAWADVNSFGDASTGLRNTFKQKYLSYVSSISSAMLYCGERGLDYYTHYGIDGSKLFCMPVEPVYEAFENASPASTFDPARKRLLFCGRFVSTKRAGDVLDAFVATAAKMPDWDLVMLGGGGLRESIVAKAQSTLPGTLPGRVLFPDFSPDPNEVARLFRACDVLVHVPEHEPWGLVINEACAAGLAVIASRAVGAAAELVKHDTNGQLVDHGDPQQLQDAMLRCADEGTLARYQKSSPDMVRAWRDKADPIAGLKQALQYCKVKP
jgi:glycosyltransferase involved in cell wall biosynthesis